MPEEFEIYVHVENIVNCAYSFEKLMFITFWWSPLRFLFLLQLTPPTLKFLPTKDCVVFFNILVPWPLLWATKDLLCWVSCCRVAKWILIYWEHMQAILFFFPIKIPRILPPFAAVKWLYCLVYSWHQSLGQSWICWAFRDLMTTFCFSESDQRIQDIEQLI